LFPSELEEEPTLNKSTKSKGKKSKSKEKTMSDTATSNMLTNKPVGDYSRDEIAWYRSQMTEIDSFLEEKKQHCATVMSEYSKRMEELLKDPTTAF
jgi:hypothetical protein